MVAVAPVAVTFSVFLGMAAVVRLVLLVAVVVEKIVVPCFVVATSQATYVRTVLVSKTSKSQKKYLLVAWLAATVIKIIQNREVPVNN